MMSLMETDSRYRLARAQGRRAKTSGLAVAALLLVSACVHLPSGPREAVGYWGFAAPWDPRSLASIRAHGSELAVVVSGWIALDSASFRPVELYTDSVHAEAARPVRFA